MALYSYYHKPFVFNHLTQLYDIIDLDSDLLSCLLQKRLITQEQKETFSLAMKIRKERTSEFLLAMTRKPLYHWRQVMDAVRERQP